MFTVPRNLSECGWIGRSWFVALFITTNCGGGTTEDRGVAGARNLASRGDTSSTPDERLQYLRLLPNRRAWLSHAIRSDGMHRTRLQRRLQLCWTAPPEWI